MESDTTSLSEATELALSTMKTMLPKVRYNERAAEKSCDAASA
jgi:hypothetical protein